MVMPPPNGPRNPPPYNAHARPGPALTSGSLESPRQRPSRCPGPAPAARRRVSAHVAGRWADPDWWFAARYTDEAIVTQVDDGRPGGMGVPTSSASAPSVVTGPLVSRPLQDPGSPHSRLNG